MLAEFHKEGKSVILSVHDPAAISLPAHIYELENGQVKAISHPSS
jgi:hypothetical protein